MRPGRARKWIFNSRLRRPGKIEPRASLCIIVCARWRRPARFRASNECFSEDCLGEHRGIKYPSARINFLGDGLAGGFGAFEFLAAASWRRETHAD